MKVFVHIGYYKTGSTALQHFFDVNRAALAEQGICYPAAGRPANDLGVFGSRLPQLSVLSLGLLESVDAHLPAWYTVGKNRESEIYDTYQQWDQACAEIKASGCELAILSSEEFVRFGEDSRHFPLVEFVRRQLGSFDVSIICYLRRPDHYLVSWYNQLVKIGVGVQRLRTSVEKFFPSIHVDYMKALQPWIDAFGQKHVILRNYEAVRRKDHGIIRDFLAAIGHPVDLGRLNLNVPRNPSIPNALVELKRLSNRLQRDPEDGKKANQALAFIEHNWDLPKDAEIEMLGLPDRYALFKAFEPIHAEISRIKGDGLPFFPALEESLFHQQPLMTDADAALKYAGIYQFVLSQMT